MNRKEAIRKIREMDEDKRRIMMLKLYGSNMVTNFKRLLAGLDREKPGIYKKAYKDFKGIIGAIDKKMEEVLWRMY